MNGKHLSSQFEADLNQLAARIMAMGGVIEAQLKLAAQALDTGADVSRVAQDQERSVNAMERDIDAHCAFVIASRQPAAQDLRFVLSMLKVCNNLERVGDEAFKLCMRAGGVHAAARHANAAGEGEFKTLSANLAQLLDLAHSIFVKALDCLARLSVVDAKAVLASDTGLDTGYRALIAGLVQLMSRHPTQAQAGVDALFLVKAIERMGDHACNIAEAVIYIVQGEDIRHASDTRVAAAA